MGTAELSQRTAVNVQEKANLIWAIADKLVGTYKPHEYGNVILPMCVIKRFSDTLAGTKDKVIEMNLFYPFKRRLLTTPFYVKPNNKDLYNRKVSEIFHNFTVSLLPNTLLFMFHSHYFIKYSKN